MKLLHLPDDCTRIVFDLLNLNQLIHIRSVCQGWNHLIITICSKKRELGLFYSELALSSYLSKNAHDNSVYKQHLLMKSNREIPVSTSKTNNSNHAFDFVAQLFPLVNKLVYEFNTKLMSGMNYFLRKLSHQLETLILFNYGSTQLANDQKIDKIICADAMHDFWTCFEQMTRLKRFHLSKDASVYFCLPYKAEQVRVFGQLEEFSFDSESRDFGPLFELLTDKCRHLRVLNHVWDNSLSPMFTNPVLTSALTRLSLSFHDPETYDDRLSQNLAQFENVTHLEILQLNSCSMAATLHQIRDSLPKLQILALNLVSFFEREQYEKIHNYRTQFPLFHDAITELHLMDSDNQQSAFRDFQEYRLLAQTFPRVEQIRVFSNQINKSIFNAECRPRLKEAFWRCKLFEIQFKNI